jgi:hypothetical protein
MFVAVLRPQGRIQRTLDSVDVLQPVRSIHCTACRRKRNAVHHRSILPECVEPEHGSIPVTLLQSFFRLYSAVIEDLQKKFIPTKTRICHQRVYLSTTRVGCGAGMLLNERRQCGAIQDNRGHFALNRRVALNGPADRPTRTAAQTKHQSTHKWKMYVLREQDRKCIRKRSAACTETTLHKP